MGRGETQVTGAPPVIVTVGQRDDGAHDCGAESTAWQPTMISSGMSGGDLPPERDREIAVSADRGVSLAEQGAGPAAARSQVGPAAGL